MATRSEKLARALDRLAELLRDRPLTARQIAKRTHCSKPTVYARLGALKERGDAVVSDLARDGKSGPKAQAYRIHGPA